MSELSYVTGGQGTGRLDRRAFLRGALLGGAGLWAFGGCGKREAVPLEALLGEGSALLPGTAQNAFLKGLRKHMEGRVVRIITEDTPPSQAASQLVAEEFTPLTGIRVEWEQHPLEDVYARMTVDVGRQRGYYDLFYIDQSWLATMESHLERIAELRALEAYAYPEWNTDDFLKPLVTHTASYRGEQLAVPYDITLFIGMQRTALLRRHGYERLDSLDTWLAATRAITRAHAPQVYGSTAQWRVGHYSLLCNMSMWLWAHGGSFLHADGSPAVADANGLAALEYMMALKAVMPPGVTTWDWHGESQSFARGEAAAYASWSEFYPVYADPLRSKVVGEVDPVPLTFGRDIRRPEECAHGETPGESHQGGSSLGLSRYSQNREAAWVFLQWLSSADIVARASMLGGSGSATRLSTYNDPRISALAGASGYAAERHFAVTLDAIQNRMGTEPHHANWPKIAMQELPIELGRMVTGQQSPRQTARRMEALIAQHITAA